MQCRIKNKRLFWSWLSALYLLPSSLQYSQVKSLSRKILNCFPFVLSCHVYDELMFSCFMALTASCCWWTRVTEAVRISCLSILGKNVGRTDGGGGGKKIIACCLRQRYLLPPHGHGCIWASHSNKLKVQQFDDIGAVDVDGQPFSQILIYSHQDLTTCMLMIEMT